ncbi:MAG TPA: lamin tail domain-containing protein [Candidatus Paceibacterota bacterium]|nr:lamin tail domain-containing protein [Candidatus Paceibacterota bacterium]
MKYIVLVLMVGILCVPLCAFAAVHITEIAWMGTPESQYSEWLELYNDDTTAVDLSGWKLYKGDGTLIFTFTKTIQPQSYLLLERITASAPDAVPGIDDESGTFGGGGLSNSGEALVLKDAQGATIQSLDFSSGWPAGDAKTKETMQWDGSGWVTAPPTPRSAFVSSSSDGETTAPLSDVTTAPTHTFDIPATSPNAPYVDFTAPPLLYSGTPYEFTMQPVLEYNYRVHDGVFTFNMGDGTVLYSATADPITHTYDYPGTYVLSFLYVDPYHQHASLQATKNITVVSPAVKLALSDAQSFQISNTAATPIDLSGWRFVFPGTTVAVPNMTIIAPNATVTIPFRTLAIAPQATVAIEDPLGTVVASTTPSASSHASLSLAHFSSSSSQPLPPMEASASPVAHLDDAGASATSPSRNHTKTIVVGVVALFVIVLSILLERVMARQEY